MKIDHWAVFSGIEPNRLGILALNVAIGGADLNLKLDVGRISRPGRGEIGAFAAGEIVWRRHGGGRPTDRHGQFKRAADGYPIR